MELFIDTCGTILWNCIWSVIDTCKYGKILLNCIWATTWDFQQCGVCDQQKLRPAYAYAQSNQRLFKSLEYSITLRLLIEHHLEFLSLKGCTGSCESTLVKMPHCWKSHVAAHLVCHFRGSFDANLKKDHNQNCFLRKKTQISLLLRIKITNLHYITRRIIWKIYMQELWFLCMTCCLNVFKKMYEVSLKYL